MRRRNSIKQAMAMLVLAALAGCGGGHDRLMPEAPELGAMLQEDATVLRPLQPGSTWTYEAESSTSPTGWRIDVSQRAFEDGVRERTSANSTDVQLAHRHGDVVHFGACGLLGAVTTCDEWVELRSPVRVGDQIELVDLDDSGHDRTGDGVPDRFEYVVYRRVVGEEQLSLPGLGSVRAVRVDTFIKQRTTETTGEQRLVEVSCATWYAPGIGIVRRHMDMPYGPVGTRRTQDERLVAWDLESAFALPAQALRP